MPEWLGKLFDWLKTPAHYFLPVLAASAFGLFAPLPLLEFLGIDFWRIEGKAYLGSAFVISGAVVACHYGAVPLRWLLEKYRLLRSLRATHARLESLTPEEQERLAGYLKENTRTQKFWLEDGVVAGLAHANIIYAAVSQADRDAFPFNIRPWVWDYLQKNPHLVGVKAFNVHKRPNSKS